MNAQESFPPEELQSSARGCEARSEKELPTPDCKCRQQKSKSVTITHWQVCYKRRSVTTATFFFVQGKNIFHVSGIIQCNLIIHQETAECKVDT